MKIGDEVYFHGYVEEIRPGMVIIRNAGGCYGLIPDVVRCKDCVFRYGATEKEVYCATVGTKMKPDDYCSYGERRE